VQLPNDYNTAGINSASTTFATTRDENACPWVLWSVGPSKIVTFPNLSSGSSRHTIYSRYDPTNGTVSFGYIMRYQSNETFPSR
jgi:hypothetical protein